MKVIGKKSKPTWEEYKTLCREKQIINEITDEGIQEIEIATKYKEVKEHLASLEDALEQKNNIPTEDEDILTVFDNYTKAGIKLPKTFKITANWFTEEFEYRPRRIGKREVLSIIKFMYRGVRKGMTLNVENGDVQLVQENIVIREWKRDSPSKVICYYEDIAEFDIADSEAVIFSTYAEQENKS